MLKLDSVAVQPHDNIRRLPDRIPLAIQSLGAAVPNRVGVPEDAVTAGEGWGGHSWYNPTAATRLILENPQLTGRSSASNEFLTKEFVCLIQSQDFQSFAQIAAIPSLPWPPRLKTGGEGSALVGVPHKQIA